VYLYYLGTHWQELSPEETVRYALAAFQDSYRCHDNYPEWNDAWLTHAQNIIYVARFSASPIGFRNVVDVMDQMVGNNWRNITTDGERSYAFNLRAQCHHFRGEMEMAEHDYGESIRLAPEQPQWYLNRAQFWGERGRPELEKVDRRKAEILTRSSTTPPAQVEPSQAMSSRQQRSNDLPRRATDSIEKGRWNVREGYRQATQTIP
jgi:hypothetical protein